MLGLRAEIGLVQLAVRQRFDLAGVAISVKDRAVFLGARVSEAVGLLEHPLSGVLTEHLADRRRVVVGLVVLGGVEGRGVDGHGAKAVAEADAALATGRAGRRRPAAGAGPPSLCLRSR